MKTQARILTLLIAGTLSLSAQATTELEKLQVTASRLDSTTQLPASITIISREDIEQSTAQNLPELLNQQAGINVRSLYGNATRATIDMRGFGATSTQNTLLLLDGRRLNDVDLSAINFAAIPFENIDRIEILRGAGAVLYGDGTSGGVINIVTQDPNLTENTVDISSTVGTHDYRELNAFASHSNQHIGITANINTVETDGYRNHNAFDQDNGQLDLRIPLSSGQIYWKLGGNRQEIELPGERQVNPGSNVNQLSSDRRGASTPNDWAKEDLVYTTLGFSQEFNDDDQLIIDAGYRRKEQQSQFDYGFGFGDYSDTEIETFSLTPRITLQHHVFAKPSTFRAGIDLYYHDYDSARSNFEENIGQPAHQIDLSQHSQALYLHNSLALSENTQLTAGWRIQHVKQNAKDQFDATAPGSAFGSEAADFDQTDTEDSYEIGVQHHFNDAFSLYARHDRSVRFGTVDELFEFDALFQQVFSPLKPQISKNFEIGGEYVTAQTEVAFAVFQQNVSNEIYFDPALFQNINLDDTEHRGVELAITQRFHSAFNLQASYGYLDATFDEGTNDGNNIPLIPEHNYKLRAYGAITDWLNYGISYQYISARYFDNDATNDFGEQIPAYQTVDLTLSGHIKQFNWSAHVNNVLNERYYNYGVRSTATPGKYNAYPLPERTLYFTGSYSF